jgi:hypothetical protein
LAMSDGSTDRERLLARLIATADRAFPGYSITAHGNGRAVVA